MGDIALEYFAEHFSNLNTVKGNTPTVPTQEPDTPHCSDLPFNEPVTTHEVEILIKMLKNEKILWF